MASVKILAALLAFAPLVVWGLRVRDFGEQPELTEDMPDSQELGLDLDRHVPEFERYRQMWQNMYALERHLQELMAPSIRLVLGLMSVDAPHEKKYRDVVRSTWMRQKGVCHWSNNPVPGCSVYVAFVFGGNASSVHEPGKFILPDTAENMNEGKSMAWFAQALQQFRWATHYGKMDLDAYPFLHKLVHRMAANRSCVGSDYEWIGRPQVYGLKNKESPFTGFCADKPCMGWFHKEGLDVAFHNEPFTFMQGQLYIFSRKLALGMNWRARWGNEDIAVGGIVREFVASTGNCVAVRRLDACAHMWRPWEWNMLERGGFIDDAYANDFEAGYADPKVAR